MLFLSSERQQNNQKISPSSKCVQWTLNSILDSGVPFNNHKYICVRLGELWTVDSGHGHQLLFDFCVIFEWKNLEIIRQKYHLMNGLVGPLVKMHYKFNFIKSMELKTIRSNQNEMTSRHKMLHIIHFSHVDQMRFVVVTVVSNYCLIVFRLYSFNFLDPMTIFNAKH